MAKENARIKREKAAKSALEIDLDRLHEEWAAQAPMYKDWADILAEARADLAEAKSARDAIEAEIKLDMRRHPEEYELPGSKPTDDTIKSAVLLEPRYKKADSVVINLQYEVETIQGTVTALDHRKKALENEVSLRLANYFSMPSEPRGKREEAINARTQDAFRSATPNRRESKDRRNDD